jgi:protein SCO1/2
MKALMLLALFWLAAAGAQPLALPVPPRASLQQRIGTVVPLDLAVRDDLGQPARLGDFFQPGEPVLLVLGYYRCPQLCGLVMHSLLEALRAGGLPPARWRIVGVSIDPQDTPVDANQRRSLDLAYARFLQGERGGTAPRIDLLVAAPTNVQRLALSIGFHYRPQQDNGGYAHPATVVLLTPSGTVARYFNGIGLDAPELRREMVAASGGVLGSFTDRLAVLCAHFAPATGRNSAAAMWLIRVIALLTLAALAAGWWCQGKRTR